MRLSALFICIEGCFDQSETGQDAGIDAKWRGVILEYSYSTVGGAYMRRKWISPFDLYGSIAWGGNKNEGIQTPQKKAIKERRD